jgi:hypothetical protein
MKKEILLTLLLLTSSLLFAQQWKPISKMEAVSILSKIKNWHKEHPDYSVNITHTSYIGYSNTVPHEQLKGYAIVHGNFYHSSLLGIETIQNSTYKVVIDTADKTMIVCYPDYWNSAIHDLPDSASLRLVGSSYIRKHDNLLSIRFEYKLGCKLEREEITIDNDYKLNEVAFYFSQGTYDETTEQNDNEKPKVVATYSEYKLKNVVTESDFDTENYIIAGDSNKLVLAIPYSDFELLDSRIK